MKKHWVAVLCIIVFAIGLECGLNAPSYVLSIFSVPKPDLPENPRFQVIDSLKVDDYRQINVLFDTRNGGNLVKLSVVGSDTFIAQLFNSDGTPVVSKTADQAHHISFEICQETGGWNNIILKDSANGVEYIWLEKQFQLLQLPSMNGI